MKIQIATQTKTDQKQVPDFPVILNKELNIGFLIFLFVV
jgi:hypothetical protein